jgi:preprotein translocase subunit YajC
MHSLWPALLAASATTTTTKPSTSASSGATSLIFIVIIALAAYFLFIRPRSQAARRQRENLQELVPGDEILTGAGIFGRVLDVESDRITIETAPGTRLTVLKSTVARRITPETIGPEGEAGVAEGGEDEEHDESGQAEDADAHDHQDHQGDQDHHGGEEQGRA